MRGFLRSKISNWVGAWGVPAHVRTESRDGRLRDSARWIPDPATEITKCDLSPDCDELTDLLPSRLDQERRADELGITLPSYRTYADLDRATAAIRAQFEVEIAAPVIGVLPDSHLASALPPEMAAQQFVDWLRARAEYGPLGDKDLIRLYSEHCAEIRVEETPQNTLRPVMNRCPGVFKRQFDLRGDNGRRVRPFMWEISAPTISRMAA